MIQVYHLPNLFPEETILDNVQLYEFPLSYTNDNFNLISEPIDSLKVGNTFKADENIEKFILSKKINDVIFDVHLIGSKENIKQGFLTPICINVNNLRMPQKKTLLCTKGIRDVLCTQNLYYLAQAYLGKILDVFVECSEFDIEFSYFVNFYKTMNNLFERYGNEQFFENTPNVHKLILELEQKMDLVQANVISPAQTIYALEDFVRMFEPDIPQKLQKDDFLHLVTTNNVIEIPQLNKQLKIDKFEKINKNEFNTDIITKRLELADVINCEIINECRLVETINSCPCTNLQLTYTIKQYKFRLSDEKMYPKYGTISKSYRNWLKYFLEPMLLSIGDYSFGEEFFHIVNKIEFIVHSDIALIVLYSSEGIVAHYFDMTYLRIISNSISTVSNEDV
jgi:hypothetical protein|nr:MAG TPA: hypothetical protein [Bacteriophage sp.]